MSEGRALAAIAAGGAIGSLGRWLIGLTAGPGAAWGTLAVNITGALALGVLVAWLEAREEHPMTRPFLAIGLLGGWTTYSSFVLDAHALGSDDLPRLVAYVVTTLLLGVAAAVAGMLLGERRWGGGAAGAESVEEGEL